MRNKERDKEGNTAGDKAEAKQDQNRRQAGRQSGRQVWRHSGIQNYETKRETSQGDTMTGKAGDKGIDQAGRQSLRQKKESK